MKTQIASLLLAALALPAAAQDLFMAPAALYAKGEDGESDYTPMVWVMAATKAELGYRVDPRDQGFTSVRRKDVLLLHFYRTQEFSDALDLFEARKYAEARSAFAAIKEQHEKLMALENNPGLLAAFHEMECLRKLGDLEGLAKALKEFDKDKLTHELKQRQLELYVMWDAVRAENWDRVVELAGERKGRKLPGSHRAQVGYCEGLALEAKGRPLDALLSYQIAMTADAGASEVVARKSALRVLEILNADPEVKESIALYEKSKGKVLNTAWTKVLEGAGVASLFEMTLGGGTALPEPFRHFLKYKPEPQPLKVEAPEKAEAPAKEQKAEEKPKDDKKQPK